MTGFIESLYLGDLSPQDQQTHLDCSQKQLLQTISTNETLLTQKLSGEEQSLFLQFTNAWDAYLSDALLHSFINGFRFGAQFSLEAFYEDKSSR